MEFILGMNERDEQSEKSEELHVVVSLVDVGTKNGSSEELQVVVT